MSWFRRHIPNRFVRLALVAGLAIVVVAAAGVLLAAAFDRGSAASATQAGTSPARSDAIVERDASTKARESARDKNSIKVRVHLGEKVSMATLAPHEAKRAVSLETSRATPKQGPPSSEPSPLASGWRLAAKPPNSQVDHSSAATTFRPDVPGRYVLVRGTDKQLLVDAAPPGELVCVNTRAEGGTKGAYMRIAGTEYQRTDTAGLQVVVLGRTNLGLINGVPVNQTFTDYSGFESFLAKLPNSALVFVNGTVSDDDRAEVWGPLARLGAADLPLPFPNVPIKFSFIGIPGLEKGQGWQAVDGNATKPVKSWCDPNVTGEPTNNLSGWLTLDSTGDNYTYVAGDDVTVDTAAPSDSGEHAIQVGNQTYTIDLGQHGNGWHALVLDRASLCPEQARADACDPPDPMLNAGYAQDGLATMATALQPLSANPDALLILAPFVGSNGWTSNVNPSPTLVGLLRDFGGSVLAPGRAFETAASRYALIGGGDRFSLPAGSAPPEISESFTGFGDDGRITGYLSRDNQNRYGPTRMQSAGDPIQGLRAIAFAPPTSWPADTSSDAYKFLSGKLDYPVDTNNPLGIRGQYDQALNWGTSLNSLSQWEDWSTLTPDQQKAAGSNKAQYDAVFKELYHEIQGTSNVHTWVAQLQKVYIGDAATSVKPLTDLVANEITQAYPPPKKDSELGTSLAHLFFSVASLIPEIGEMFDVAGEVLDVGLEIARTATGEPQDVRGQVFKSAEDMQDAALGFLSNSNTTLNHLAAIITTDSTKLEIVGKKTGPVDDPKSVSDDDEHPWAIHDDQMNKLQSHVSQGLTRWLMPAVVDAGFKVWQVQIPSLHGNILNGNDATPPTYKCNTSSEDFPIIRHPFGDLHDDRAWIKLDNGTMTYSLALAGINHSAGQLENGGHAAAPSQQLLDTLFNAGPDDLAFNRVWFLEQGFGETVGNEKFYVEC